MTRYLVWLIALLAAVGVIWAVADNRGRVSPPTSAALGAAANAPTSNAYPAPVEPSPPVSAPNVVVTSGAAARAIVEDAVPQVTTAEKVVVRTATRRDLDDILGLTRHDVPGQSASTDRIWILAYESASGFDSLGELEAAMGPSGVAKKTQPIAYFAVDSNSGRISQFGLLPSLDKMLEFSRLPGGD